MTSAAMCRSGEAPHATSLARLSVVDELESRLLADIFAGRFAPGERLPTERNLAAAYDVARATVKQTLVRLETRGLIRTRHGVGSVVADYARAGGIDLLPLLAVAGEPLDAAALLADVFAARRAIGAEIAAAAAADGDRAWRGRIRPAVAAVAAGATAAECQLAEAEVHRVLAELSRNRVWILLTNSFLAAYAQFHAVTVAVFAAPDVVCAALAPLADAVAAGDPAAAATAAVDYLDMSAAAFGAALAESA